MSGQWPRIAAMLGFAVGLIGLGALSVIYRDFALVWEPVPRGVPWRPMLGVLSGLILVAAGGLLLVPSRRVWGAALAAVFIGFWALGLHLPAALAHPAAVAGWQAVAESAVMAGGGLVLLRGLRRGRGRDPLGPLIIVGFGACFVVFGASHFAYARFTAAMIPAWLPQPMALTWLTGAVHIATGVAILVGFRRRWAAAIEGLMMSAFVLMLHIPLVIAHPHDRMDWTMLFIAVTLTSAVWTLAASAVIEY